MKTIVILQAIFILRAILYSTPSTIPVVNMGGLGIFDYVTRKEFALLVTECKKTPEHCRIMGEEMFNAAGQYYTERWMGKKNHVLGISVLIVGTGVFATQRGFQLLHELKEQIELTTKGLDGILAEIDALNRTTIILQDLVSKLWDDDVPSYRDMEKILKLIKVTKEGTDSVSEKVAHKIENFTLTLASNNCRCWKYATAGGAIAAAVGPAYPQFLIGIAAAPVGFVIGTTLKDWSWWTANSQSIDSFKYTEISGPPQQHFQY